MKKLILFIFSIILIFSIANAQDGINYQGAATDVNGDELTNQNITIRASVLSGSANGNLEWEETHSTTTDQFGLFNVVIGQGTNTTNGATATFDDMDWGSVNHYLKIEMDATGGTNYAMIGTTQMMSVPYALYAKSAGIDSTMLANMIANAVSNSSGSSVPTGIVQAYSGTTSPTGWLLCDGSAVSRTSYPDLFTLIDTTYGQGDGSTTFNLPDLRGRTIIGLDNMGGIPANVVSGINSLGVIGGSETHTLTIAEMPSHSHSFYAVGSQGNGNWNDGATNNAIGNTFITTSSEGGDQPHNNMQPFLSLNYIIKY